MTHDWTADCAPATQRQIAATERRRELADALPPPPTPEVWRLIRAARAYALRCWRQERDAKRNASTARNDMA